MQDLHEHTEQPKRAILCAVQLPDVSDIELESSLEELAEQAELIKAFLDKTRRVLGMRLPVHVVINRCDIIPGFRSFAETLPEGRRDDIFGWAIELGPPPANGNTSTQSSTTPARPPQSAPPEIPSAPPSPPNAPASSSSAFRPLRAAVWSTCVTLRLPRPSTTPSRP
jgi:hypothetical protein